MIMRMNTYLTARAKSRELKQSHTMPVAKHSEGDQVQTGHGEATVLHVLFNRAVWAHSYKVAVGDDVLEIMEWGL
jgi:hypothetical protein